MNNSKTYYTPQSLLVATLRPPLLSGGILLNILDMAYKLCIIYQQMLAKENSKHLTLQGR